MILAAVTATDVRISAVRFSLRKVGISDFAGLTDQGFRSALIGSSLCIGNGGDLRTAEDPERLVHAHIYVQIEVLSSV